VSEPEADGNAIKPPTRRTAALAVIQGAADGTADPEMDVRRFGVDDFAGEPAFEVFGQGEGAGITPLRVKLQATQTNRLESVLRWIGRFGSGQARRSCDSAESSAAGGVGTPGQQRMEDGAQTVNIAGG